MPCDGSDSPRELDERLGLSALIDQHLSGHRTGRNSQFLLPDLLRQSIYSRRAGYEDTNDAERLAEDPTFRMLASRERRDTSVALTSTPHWFETDVLAGGAELPRTRSPQHGTDPAHFGSINPGADCLTAKLRPGNVHSADGWDDVLLPIMTGPARRARPSSFARTRPSRCPPSTRRWTAGGCGTRLACRRTPSLSGRSKIRSLGAAADRATPRWFAIAASRMRRLPGTGRGA
jgi:hypothetical protein